jgi:hypothetical protein
MYLGLEQVLEGGTVLQLDVKGIELIVMPRLCEAVQLPHWEDTRLGPYIK